MTKTKPDVLYSIDQSVLDQGSEAIRTEIERIGEIAGRNGIKAFRLNERIDPGTGKSLFVTVSGWIDPAGAELVSRNPAAERAA